MIHLQPLANRVIINTLQANAIQHCDLLCVALSIKFPILTVLIIARSVKHITSYSNQLLLIA